MGLFRVEAVAKLGTEGVLSRQPRIGGLWALVYAFTLGPAQAVDVGGLLDQDQTWTAAEGPYVFAHAVTVPEGVTLRIEAGVEVQLRVDTALLVDGELLAEGTESEPIHFIQAPRALGTSGTGLGLAFRNQALATLTHVDINGLTYGVHISGDATAHLAHVVARNTDTGIWLANAGRATLTDVVVRGADMGIQLDDQSHLDLHGVKLIDVEVGLEVSSDVDGQVIQVENLEVTNSESGAVGVRVRGHAQVALDGVQIQNVDQGIDWQSTTAAALCTIKNVFLANDQSGLVGIRVGGNARVAIENAELRNVVTGLHWTSSVDAPGQTVTQVTVENPRVSGGTTGILIRENPRLAIDGAILRNVDVGVDWSGDSALVEGRLHNVLVDNSEFNHGAAGIRVGGHARVAMGDMELVKLLKGVDWTSSSAVHMERFQVREFMVGGIWIANAASVFMNDVEVSDLSQVRDANPDDVAPDSWNGENPVGIRVGGNAVPRIELSDIRMIRVGGNARSIDEGDGPPLQLVGNHAAVGLYLRGLDIDIDGLQLHGAAQRGLHFEDAENIILSNSVIRGSGGNGLSGSWCRGRGLQTLNTSQYELAGLWGSGDDGYDPDLELRYRAASAFGFLTWEPPRLVFGGGPVGASGGGPSPPAEPEPRWGEADHGRLGNIAPIYETSPGAVTDDCDTDYGLQPMGFVTLENVTIESNWGAGSYLAAGYDLMATGSAFNGNLGPGLVVVSGEVFVDGVEAAQNEGHGLSFFGQGTVTSSLFWGNFASGLHVQTQPSAAPNTFIAHNTIDHNGFRPSPQGVGSGVSIHTAAGSAPARIENTLLTGNGGYAVKVLGVAPILANVVAADNELGDFEDGVSIGLTGLVDLAPHFRDVSFAPFPEEELCWRCRPDGSIHRLYHAMDSRMATDGQVVFTQRIAHAARLRFQTNRYPPPAGHPSGALQCPTIEFFSAYEPGRPAVDLELPSSCQWSLETGDYACREGSRAPVVEVWSPWIEGDQIEAVLDFANCPDGGWTQEEPFVITKVEMESPALDPLSAARQWAQGHDYGLAPDSPLIDRGTPPRSAQDFLGNPRFADGDGDGQAMTDIGAFEVESPAADPLPDPPDEVVVEDSGGADTEVVGAQDGTMTPSAGGAETEVVGIDDGTMAPSAGGAETEEVEAEDRTMAPSSGGADAEAVITEDGTTAPSPGGADTEAVITDEGTTAPRPGGAEGPQEDQEASTGGAPFSDEPPTGGDDDEAATGTGTIPPESAEAAGSDHGTMDPPQGGEPDAGEAAEGGVAASEPIAGTEAAATSDPAAGGEAVGGAPGHPEQAQTGGTPGPQTDIGAMGGSQETQGQDPAPSGGEDRGGSDGDSTETQLGGEDDGEQMPPAVPDDEWSDDEWSDDEWSDELLHDSPPPADDADDSTPIWPPEPPATTPGRGADETTASDEAAETPTPSEGGGGGGGCTVGLATPSAYTGPAALPLCLCLIMGGGLGLRNRRRKKRRSARGQKLFAAMGSAYLTERANRKP